RTHDRLFEATFTHAGSDARDGSWARLLNQRAHLMSRLGRFSEAEGLAAETVAVAQDLGDGWLEGAALVGLAWAGHKLGRPAEGLTIIQRSYAPFRRARNLPWKGIALVSEAMLLNAAGRHEEARAAFIDAFDILKGEALDRLFVLENLAI